MNTELPDIHNPTPEDALRHQAFVILSRLQSGTEDVVRLDTALAAVAAERERCAMLLQVTRADVLLAAGDMTAQEWRTCTAVLRWMQTRIRAEPLPVSGLDRTRARSA